MRAMAYSIAALAAAGIMFGIAVMPNPSADEGSVPAQPATTSPSPSPSATSSAADEGGTLVLSVPNMHCEFSCFPSVKKILEGADAVKSVELAEQKEEGTIDNRQVIVNYDAGFDVQQAIVLLGEGGFDKSDVVQ